LLTLPSIIALCFLIVFFLTFLLNPIRPIMPEVQGKWWRVRADGVLGLAKTNFYFEERENLIENWQTGMRNSFFGKVLHNLLFFG